MIPSFFNVQTLDVTASTNDDVKTLAMAGEAEGTVIRAKQQTAGRGRMGRVWDSPEKNLYVSVLLRPACSLQEAGLYSFVASLAVRDAIEGFRHSAEVRLKWPNDVLLNNKKVSGILLETSGETNGIVDWLVMGVGVNVFSHPIEALYPTTSLYDEGLHTKAEEVLEAFLVALDHWRTTLLRDGFRPVRRAWLASAKGGKMIVRLPTGEREGYFSGLDDEGRLILRLEDGREEIINTGDVFFKGQDNAVSD